jgi:hypothetical protein
VGRAEATPRKAAEVARRRVNFMSLIMLLTDEARGLWVESGLLRVRGSVVVDGKSRVVVGGKKR